jgi:hypothetical protein
MNKFDFIKHQTQSRKPVVRGDNQKENVKPRDQNIKKETGQVSRGKVRHRVSNMYRNIQHNLKSLLVILFVRKTLYHKWQTTHQLYKQIWLPNCNHPFSNL